MSRRITITDVSHVSPSTPKFGTHSPPKRNFTIVYANQEDLAADCNRIIKDLSKQQIEHGNLQREISKLHVKNAALTNDRDEYRARLHDLKQDYRDLMKQYNKLRDSIPKPRSQSMGGTSRKCKKTK